MTVLPDGDPPLDPAASRAIIEAQRTAVREHTEPDGRLLFGGWGAAWLIGYLALYLTARGSADHEPTGWAFSVFAGLLLGAVVVTVVHVVRRTAGVAGPSQTSGTMYGLSWTVGFVAIYLVMSGLERAGASPEVLSLAWNALPCLLTGVLYLCGGALWQSWAVYALGVWMVLVGGVATIVGLPTTYLVMALAGGGGLLTAALLAHLSRRRHRAGSR